MRAGIIERWRQFLVSVGCIEHTSFEELMRQSLLKLSTDPAAKEYLSCDEARINQVLGLSDEEFRASYEPLAGRGWVRIMSVPVMVEQMKAILGLLGNPERALDVGCGPFSPLFFLSAERKITSEVFCLDTSDKMLQSASSFASILGVEAIMTKGTVEEIPFGDGRFDFVMCNDVITWTTRWRKSVKELARVTSDRLLISFSVRDPRQKMDPLEVVSELTSAGMNVVLVNTRRPSEGQASRCYVCASKTSSTASIIAVTSCH